MAFSRVPAPTWESAAANEGRIAPPPPISGNAGLKKTKKKGAHHGKERHNALAGKGLQHGSHSQWQNVGGCYVRRAFHTNCAAAFSAQRTSNSGSEFHWAIPCPRLKNSTAQRLPARGNPPPGSVLLHTVSPFLIIFVSRNVRIGRIRLPGKPRLRESP